MIAALPVILLALQEGRLVIIDEMDAKLHPKLLRYVISLFKNTNVNKKGAQLLFTSHDMTTMKNTVFRPDEIWFAAENEKHESEIYSLYEIRRENNERVNKTGRTLWCRSICENRVKFFNCENSVSLLENSSKNFYN